MWQEGDCQSRPEGILLTDKPPSQFELSCQLGVRDEDISAILRDSSCGWSAIYPPRSDRVTLLHCRNQESEDYSCIPSTIWCCFAKRTFCCQLVRCLVQRFFPISRGMVQDLRCSCTLHVPLSRTPLLACVNLIADWGPIRLAARERQPRTHVTASSGAQREQGYLQRCP